MDKRLAPSSVGPSVRPNRPSIHPSVAGAGKFARSHAAAKTKGLLRAAKHTYTQTGELLTSSLGSQWSASSGATPPAPCFYLRPTRLYSLGDKRARLCAGLSDRPGR